MSEIIENQKTTKKVEARSVIMYLTLLNGQSTLAGLVLMVLKAAKVDVRRSVLWSCLVTAVVDLIVKGGYAMYIKRQSAKAIVKRTHRLILEVCSAVKDLICLAFTVDRHDSGGDAGGRL